jgi:glycosyltransferase involved in cell wall biosynthesis
MECKKKVLAVISVLKGGGAERVLSLLANELSENGYEVEFLTTSSKKDEIINHELNKGIPLTGLKEEFLKESRIKRGYYKLLRVASSVLCKPFELLRIDLPISFAYLSFVAEYHREIKAMRNKLAKEPNVTVISFLQPSIPITLIAAKDLPNRVIISERCDPDRLMKSRYGGNFLKKYYDRADRVVFQTEQAKNIYPENISAKGTVIFNPLKAGLPQPYHGERNNNITTFCRISKQKNLPMLIEAFGLIHKDFPEYRLRIIGQPNNADDREALEQTKAKIEQLGIEDAVDFQPFSNQVHGEIIQDAMYVNSSDYEGISNAMLEAMAIGMPSVCTDCPIGGAAMMIENGVNGLLVPVGDSQKLATAVIRVLEDKEFAHALSCNAEQIRQDLSIKKIGQQWLEIIQ